MPYTQSALEEQLKRGESLSSGLPWKLFSLSLIVFSSLMVIYVGMILGYKPYLNSQISKNQANLDSLSQSIDESKQKQLLDLYSQSINIKNLVNSKRSISKIFDFIESNTYPSVKYTNFRLNGEDYTATLEGTAPDYDTLAKELALFQKNNFIDKVSLSGSSINTDSSSKTKGVSELKFSVNLIFKKDIFKSQ